jgi:hypothetical protein
MIKFEITPSASRLYNTLPESGSLSSVRHFTECNSLGTRQRLRDRHFGAVTVTFLCRVPGGTRQILCRRVLDKKVLGKEATADIQVVDTSLPRVTLGKSSCVW